MKTTTAGQIPMPIFNVFAKDYRLIVTFTDEIDAKTWLSDPSKWNNLVPTWVGIFKDGEAPRTVPMWDIESFVKQYNL